MALACGWTTGLIWPPTGSSSALWAILDEMVDDDVPVIEALYHDLDEVEDTVFADRRQPPSGSITYVVRSPVSIVRCTHCWVRWTACSAAFTPMWTRPWSPSP